MSPLFCDIEFEPAKKNPKFWTRNLIHRENSSNMGKNSDWWFEDIVSRNKLDTETQQKVEQFAVENLIEDAKS